MIYGHGRFWQTGRRDRPARFAEPLQVPGPGGWRGLDPDCRIALIEQSLAIAATAG